MAQKPIRKKNSRREVMRTCAACRRKAPKKEMIRLVLKDGSEPVIDEKGRLGGRGVNVCADVECVEKAIASKACDRAWKVSLPDEEWADVRSRMEKIPASAKPSGNGETDVSGGTSDDAPAVVRVKLADIEAVRKKTKCEQRTAVRE